MAVAANVGRATAVEPVAEPVREAACGLYERHGARVLRFCLARLRSREEAEDAGQTTFLYAFAALRRGVVPVAELSWLLKIADNVCKSRGYAATRRSRFEVVQDPEALQRVSAPAGAPVETLMPLQEALGRLTEPQRQALLLREWRGLSSLEIAERLDTTPGAVDVLLLRARRALAEGLEAPAAPSRRLRSLDLASLASAAKSLFGGGLAGKAAAAMAIVAAVGASVGALALRGPDPGERAPRPDSPRRTVSAADRMHALPVSSLPARPQREPRPARVAPPPPAARTAPAVQAPAPTEAAAPPRPATAAEEAPAAAPARATDPVTSVLPDAEPLLGQVVSATEPVVETVGSTVEPVVDTVTATVEPVVAAASETLPLEPVLP